jgi:hypothetical protein
VNDVAAREITMYVRGVFSGGHIISMRTKGKKAGENEACFVHTIWDEEVRWTKKID